MSRRDCSDRWERCRSKGRDRSRDARCASAIADPVHAGNIPAGSDTATCAFAAAGRRFVAGQPVPADHNAGDTGRPAVVAAGSVAAGVPVTSGPAAGDSAPGAVAGRAVALAAVSVAFGAPSVAAARAAVVVGFVVSGALLVAAVAVGRAAVADSVL